ncbi:MAG TPA: dienelactone hydrolase family protein [Thermoanaerobaculia bacterium]|nr:dienelactone hydrolase family protein [Thermoanaerobaculia bacterium]
MEKRVQLVTYPNTGHAFCNDTGANYNATAAADAWQKAIDFFRANVT